MDISTRSKEPKEDPVSTEKTAPKRRFPSPPHSSNGHSPQDSSTSPIKKKKKPGLLNSSNKEQSELRHGPFYYMKQPLTTDPVDVVPQDGRNDFYCWVCHREGQVLCCELCPRVYHAKCLRLTSEPEGDWFCPECEKITVAECIETQSKAMTMLTIEQLSYLLKFAIQKMKQPGTDAFQKPVPLEQHPDYAEYIFHPMDLCTLEKNAKKKMYGCTEAFLADAKWILHNCIIYNGGNHKLTQIAKVVIKICEHEMNEIEVCPECYLAACQKRDNWFCEPCSNPHPLVWAKLKGFPFWPAKALRDKDGQVDARFFGQHDRAWVPVNNCYLMSKEIPFSVKKTKSIFNSAMQEMEVYVENIRRKFGVFNYSPFRTPYTPNNQYQMLLDPSNPSAGTAKTDKQEKVKLNFDMTASPKILLSKPLLSGGAGRRISLSDMPRSPTSTNSSVHTGSDVEQDPEKKAPSSHFSASEESMDFLDKSTASPASTKTGQAGSLSGSPKPFSPQAPTPIMTKPDKTSTSTTGSILNLNLDRSKAEMDLKELSESVQQQSAPVPLISPKRQIRSRFQLNLDKTIESCKAQLGINEISEDVYTAVEHSDSEDSEKSESSDSEYVSDEEQKPKNEPEDPEDKEGSRVDKEAPAIKRKPKPTNQVEVKEEAKSNSPVSEKPDPTPAKDKASPEPEKDFVEKAKPSPHPTKDKLKGKDETDSPTVHLGLDSDSESELVIDLGEDPSGREGRKNKKDPKVPSPKQDAIGKPPPSSTSAGNQSPPETPVLTRSATQAPAAGVTVAAATTSTMSTVTVTAPATAVTGSPVKKQRPLLPKETVPAVQRVVWNASSKFQTSSQKWHMQKIQRQQQQQQQQQQSQQQSQQQQPQSSQGTRYQTRQAVKAVQQKEVTQSPSTSTITLVTSTQPAALVSSSGSASTLASAINADLPIATASADVAADIAKYTSKMMDAIKGTMTEIYNDLSKNTTGSTIAEIRRLRIEIEKLQWLHQQELAEMKHNLELTMAEMRQSLEQERDRLIAEVKKQLELEKQQAVDETKKKQWCANCKKEAIFYCCWNTSYCDYPCQQAHWPEHMKSCTQSATAPQQEADAEASTETGNKSSQGNSSNTQSAPSEPASAPKEKEAPAEKSKDSSNSTLDLSGSRETPSSMLLGSNQSSVSKRCDKQPAYTPTTTDHQPHPNYPAQKYHSRSSKAGLWSSSEEKRASSRSEHSGGTSTKNLMPKESRESRLDAFWD
ncbi:MYND-type zinc finger-containing chromatin reader ZMYND8 isoform X8 [Mus musculus]|uniref:Zinc finger, MYND-type containing 8 n=4 Tax=Mus musculus TaxID=10090 RepID=A2A484_MOUSE|nr:MYND-type zinc finger-containing chromatin reader ZMYND8 isoform 6 [Mus musculus]XP_006499454.1 MYND-type zinc finger-containing chromatin reader ZMYND8 isoform X8 [Mus musculus]XP_011237810.1 MYND-type zinc finger-containing chromatin reader ZMYND8 isoform X8 [Mus musculus]XP_030106545.1 MYND-type zinc finger-containing chromatin reader ZMYND8 isoform X8 [Mus musculus]XP_036017548.1 MYND-type zinc finger-containing chromatin reader ZMYND8 isoform X8 [Mus musculus]XP_036017549.1 MYND-type z|eukprot:NP_001278087.1 protein kinase C-binding protein 1 isoform 6 [Mus musculus]